MQTVFAGIAFGLWPLFLNRSGLSGNIGTLVFLTATLACVVICSLLGGINGSMIGANWIMLAGAAIMSALGLIAFNSMLDKTAPKDVSVLFVLMIVVQTATPIAYYVITNGQVSGTKCIGFALSIAAAILLLK